MRKHGYGRRDRRDGLHRHVAARPPVPRHRRRERRVQGRLPRDRRPGRVSSAGARLPIVAVTNLEFYSSRNGIYSPGLGYLADELSNPATAFGPPGTANAITTVDKEGTKTGSTGYSSLAIPDTLSSNVTIGLIPNCIE